MPVYGNGDIVNFEDYNAYRKLAPRVSGVMIARGALIKPWVFKEIKEQKHWDISPQERYVIILLTDESYLLRLLLRNYVQQIGRGPRFRQLWA